MDIAVRPADPTADIYFTNKPLTDKQPISISLGPHVENTCLYHVEPRDIVTVALGSQHRQTPVPLPINRETLRKFRQSVMLLVRSRLTPLPRVMTFPEWLAQSGYNETEKALLTAARARWDERFPNIPNKKPFDWVSCKIFVKDEFYPEIKHARIICCRSLEWLSFSGPIMKSLESEVYKLPCFIKGCTPAERVPILETTLGWYAVYYEGDYSSFERGFVPQFLNACEIPSFRYLLRGALNPTEMFMLCGDMQGVGAFMTRFKHTGLRVSVSGRRKSGDAHTSLANGFTNFCLWRFAMMEAGLPESEAENVKVEGDDNVGSNTGVDERFISQKMLELGFDLKLIKSYEKENTAFCQTTWVAETGHVVRHPAPILAKFGWSKSAHVQFNDAHLDMLLRAKAFSLAAELPGCPIVWALAEAAIRHTDATHMDWEFVKRHTNVFDRDRLVFEHKRVEPLLPDRIRVERLYGISVPTQLEIERYLLLQLQPRCPISHPLVHDLMPQAWRDFYSVMARSDPVPCGVRCL